MDRRKFLKLAALTAPVAAVKPSLLLPESTVAQAAPFSIAQIEVASETTFFGAGVLNGIPYWVAGCKETEYWGIGRSAIGYWINSGPEVNDGLERSKGSAPPAIQFRNG